MSQRVDGARLVVQTWLGTRLLIALVAVWLLLTQGRRLAAEAVLANWDVQHFLAIARDGYANPADIAFFPGWPLLLRLASFSGLPPVLAGTLLALIASGFAAAALHRLGGHRAAIAWLLAPTAVFTIVPYTEALFCAAAFWAWERASARQWGAAAALTALAASVRVSGVFLILALAVLALTQGRRQRWRRLAWLLIPTAVLAAYLGYLRFLTGSWTAWYEAQATGWSRGFTWPWTSLQHTLDVLAPGAYADHPEWRWLFTAELISMAVGLIVTGISLFRRRWAEAVWVGSQVAAFSVSYWFMSVNRAVLLWFPLWILLGQLAHHRGRQPTWRAVLLGLLIAAALVIQVVWAWLFFTGRWAS